MIDPILVLTSAAGVSDAVLARARAAGGTVRRLAPTAAEVAGEMEGLRAVLGEEMIDFNIIPAAGREKRLLIADMDSTMIPVECIDEIADFAGVKPQVSDITERAMRGELDFEAALCARVALLKGLPESVLEETYRTRISLNPGARTLVRTMAARGAMTALVSGGFTYFTERVAAEAGFAVHQANTLIFEDGKLTGAVKLPILGREAKREALLKLCSEAGITPAEAIAVGDGANDLAMVELAGLGVAYKAKPALAEEADARITHGDLTALLSLQGIGAENYAV
ncbi:phosphoserine phosphatase SerB [Paroceanicella profunda]|uniref:Phosphoserine phosphatase n=1 Tax=Paroceanicella profunda TaxID=2579971 RepID=A0A5B8FGC5_9RHOB|nr:phosphoserine phosphatase SerB [Paroceanicella profunda]QDL90698.1 phosphoserine phosphatase SerB [Paroceanicella profunda]